MSILLYCVTEKSELPNPGAGVAGLPVLSLEHGALAALFSHGASREGWTSAPLKDSARQFHQVLHRVFESRAIIPFRFPTLMGEPEDLNAHLRANSSNYLTQLGKFRTSVQMDITITYAVPKPVRGQATGKEYLHERQKRFEELERIASQLQDHTHSTARAWRTRPAQQGLRVFVLLHRDSAGQFNQNLQKFAVPAGLSIRISGPWPVAEFLELTQGG